MNMQDKELDDLFRSKLDGLEVQPNAHVWTNIAAELGGAKKRNMMPALRIAASVVIVMAAGAWFAVHQNNNVQNLPVHQVAHTTVKAVPITEQSKTETPALVSEQPLHRNLSSTNKLVSNLPKASLRKATIQQPEAIKVVNTVNEPVMAQPEQALAVVAIEPVKPQAVLPDVPLSVKSIDAEQSAVKPVNTMAAVSEPAKKVAKKRGIRSFGDLINVVVAKVDKREDKIIEFTNTDDDEATITGVNLGIVKVKKEK